MPGTTRERELRLDQTGLREEHRHRELPTSRAVATAWLLAVTAALTVLPVLAVGTDEPDVLDRPRWHPRTALRPDDLDVRDRGVCRDRCARWWVREVTCRPARRCPGTAVPQDGRRLRLVGMSADDVDRPALALSRARAARPRGGP